MDSAQDSCDIDDLMSSMTLTQKVGQLNQRLFGWKCLKRVNGKLTASDYLKEEIDRWGGLGLLYGLFRADPWSQMDWGNGIRPEERMEASALVQQTVVERGAHGIGVLLSEEAPHGHQALGGTILPVNLALGATFDPELVEQAQRSVGSELYESGVHIALVSGLDIARDPRWGRCEECFGEDPCLAVRMCEATVKGMQGEGRSLVGHGGVAVVMKHLAAQGEAIGGRNGQSAIIGSNDLCEIHLPPVVASVKAGAYGFMAAYNDIDGVPCCANPKLLKTYLRDELGFDGIVMADGLAVDRLSAMTGSNQAAGLAALLGGVDVSLWDEGFASLDTSVAEIRSVDETSGLEPLGRHYDIDAIEAAIDRSVRRVLLLKQRFSLLPHSAEQSKPANIDKPESLNLTSTEKGSQHPSLCQTADNTKLRQALAQGERCSRACAQACLVELKNDGRADWSGLGPGPIVITGALADDAACFYGDYTAPLSLEKRTTLYRQMHMLLPDSDVRLLPMGEKDDALLREAALIVNVAGGTSERLYKEDFADNGAAGDAGESRATGGEGVDLASIRLPWHQDEWLEYVHGTSSSPVVSVVVSGRPQVLTQLNSYSDKVIWAGYAGPYGAEAVASAILGRNVCTGMLSVTLPSTDGVEPVHYNDRQPASNVYKDAKAPVLYPFGFSDISPVRAEKIVIESAQVLRVVSCENNAIEVRRNEDLVGKIRISMQLGTPSPSQSQSEWKGRAVNLFIRTSGGSLIPRQRRLVAIFSARQRRASEDSVISRVLPYEAVFDVKEGSRVELLDDMQAPYGVIAPTNL
ncbi:glycoside hydrolase family 3 C-terminal domain-containing protein [Bifidobacterium sp. ESL0728]|uniref:glycoside hydrolase family 3 protein n=1 Tax=Bifidobacterium sp. ESL0728 TaxID=2983220 RepID=UPI0023F9596C|nr:glycoside hydrolase family 3 N-terminal domain-containing protein [Bifidobacterium sp. ESL0728]WEV58519.1 glycoside hydrolase family 3 C-terminal domain-containing protein [Bifidobacterium sp. ESL0728]